LVNRINKKDYPGEEQEGDLRRYLWSFNVLSTLNPTTTHITNRLMPFFSSDATSKSRDFGAEPILPIQWPFLYQTLSAVKRFSATTTEPELKRFDR